MEISNVYFYIFVAAIVMGVFLHITVGGKAEESEQKKEPLKPIGLNY